jgi:hypothetical protein
MVKHEMETKTHTIPRGKEPFAKIIGGVVIVVLLSAMMMGPFRFVT